MWVHQRRTLKRGILGEPGQFLRFQRSDPRDNFSLRCITGADIIPLGIDDFLSLVRYFKIVEGLALAVLEVSASRFVRVNSILVKRRGRVIL